MEDANMTTLAIVGARFRPPAQAVLENLSSGTKLLLKRQPDNPYDSNAVQVMLPLDENHGDTVSGLLLASDIPFEEPLHLGFIPRDDAATIAPIMDQQYLNGDGDGVSEWPGTLTFLLSGQPAISFIKPE
jgi:hypothetical protein